jgi:DNA replication protein DnaC
LNIFSNELKNIREKMIRDREERELKEYGRTLTDEERALNLKKLHEAEIEEESKKIKEAEEVERNAVLKSRYAQVPDRYKSSTLDSYRNDAFKASAEYRMLVNGASAIIYGGYGCGKTHLGWALCKNRWDKGDDALYSTAQSIYTSIKRQFGGGDPELEMRKHQTAPYLVIDEIDKSYGSQLEYITLFEIVNYRYNWLLPTVVLLNAEKKEDIPALIGGACYDRLGAAGLLIHLSQGSLRSQEKKIFNEF